MTNQANKIMMYGSIILMIIIVIASMQNYDKPEHSSPKMQTENSNQSIVINDFAVLTPAVSTPPDNTPPVIAPPEKIVASKEILNADMYSNTLQIGNTVITKPPSFQDFVDAGAKLVSKDVVAAHLMCPSVAK